MAEPAVLANAAVYDDFDPVFIRLGPAVSPLFQGEFAESFFVIFDRSRCRRCSLSPGD
jgi:hypothetical protein